MGFCQLQQATTTAPALQADETSMGCQHPHTPSSALPSPSLWSTSLLGGHLSNTPIHPPPPPPPLSPVSQDREPDVEKYFKPRTRLRRSKPRQAMRGPAVSQEVPPPPVASVPLDPTKLPLNPAPDSSFFTNDAPGGGLGTEVEQRVAVEGEPASRDGQSGWREESSGEARGEEGRPAEKPSAQEKNVSRDREGDQNSRSKVETDGREGDDRGGPRGGGGGGGGGGSSGSPVKEASQFSESRLDDEWRQARLEDVGSRGSGQQESGIQMKQELVQQQHQRQFQHQEHQQPFVSVRAAAASGGATTLVLPVEAGDSVSYGSSFIELWRELVRSVWLPLVAPWPQRDSRREEREDDVTMGSEGASK